MKVLSKDIKRFWLVIALGLWLSQAQAQPQAQGAADAILRIKPTRCIALHEGQTCYQTLKVEWQADAVDSYCLYQQDNKTPVLCWENLASARGSYEFESDSTRKFILMRKRDNKILAESSVEVAWVYDSRSRRESHWRIF
jgi:hypothetical protein